MGQLWTVLTNLNSLAGPTIMLLYPLYASVCAIESESKVDDEQWLAYWILYSLLTLTELVAEPVIYWIPLWYPMKVLLVAWLVLPHFRGASYIYEKFVRKQLEKMRTKRSSGGSSHDHQGKELRERFLTYVKPGKGDQEVY